MRPQPASRSEIRSAPFAPRSSSGTGNSRQRLLERATLALGRLDSITLLLPDPNIFLYAYIRREAVLSSQIEGTQSTLADLLLFELEEVQGCRSMMLLRFPDTLRRWNTA